MKISPTTKAPAKKKGKRTDYKQLIVKLAKLIAKDAAKAMLSPTMQKKITKELGLVLEQVDAGLPKTRLGSAKCFCTYDGAANCILRDNCEFLGGHCTAAC